MSKPFILIVPGSFALSSFYDPVVNAISTHGYSIRCLSLPTISPSPSPFDSTPPSMYADAIFIAHEVENLANEGKDIILIGHSYGGVPLSESIKGLGKEEREKEGKKGGVVRIGFLTALVPEVGVSAAGVMGGVPKELRLDLKIDEQGWMYHDPSASAPICFSDLPPSEGEAFMKTFARHSAISFSNELTYAGYKYIPVSWLLCEEDMCIPEKNQREAIKLIERVSGRIVDVTEIKSGHCPPITKPQEVVDWILDVAGKAV